VLEILTYFSPLRFLRSGESRPAFARDDFFTASDRASAMELRHLRYFVAVAEELHFTRAAQRLGIGQPPLSQQIQQLEAEIGTPLFRRLPRRIQLTEAGSSFFEDARAMLDQAEKAKERARRAARGELGRIRVGMINSAPFHALIPRILREYRARHPQVALSLDENYTPELAAQVRDERLDIAFIRPLLGPEPGLVTERLFDEPVLVALPQGHPRARSRSIPLAALSLEAFVLFPRAVGSGLHDEIMSSCRRAGFAPRIAQETSQVTSIVNLVAAGLGISLVPASMQQVHSEGVVFRPIRGDAPIARMSLVYREQEDSAPVQHLLALARALAAAPGAARTPARGPAIGE
jgi:DNA-binding transcriptional LysR family regulator